MYKLVETRHEEGSMTMLIKTDILVLTLEEVKTVIEELDHTYVNKENEAYVRVLDKMSNFIIAQGKSDVGKNQND
jgi:6-pyruvoyl-tetrahydropterin synthase